MFKHYVFDSEVSFLGESDLIGLSAIRINFLKVYQHLFASDGFTE